MINLNTLSFFDKLDNKSALYILVILLIGIAIGDVLSLLIRKDINLDIALSITSP